MAEKKQKTKSKNKAKENDSIFSHFLKVLAGTTILLLLVAATGLLALFLFPPETLPPAFNAESTDSGRPVYEVFPEKDEVLRVPKPEITPSDRPAVPKVAIIIDDFGYDKKIAKRFLALDIPISFSILPFSPYSKTIARAAHAKGAEVMLHLPMEPVEYPHVNPGPGVLLTSMSPDRLIEQLEADLAEIPHISGVNNHMGSRLTTVSSQLYQIFSILKKRRLFFIDSRTTGDTLCRPSARMLRVPFAQRDVFIDNSLEKADIQRQIEELMQTACKYGSAIGIGHPHPNTYRVLRKMLPELQKNVRLVKASDLVRIVDT